MARLGAVITEAIVTNTDATNFCADWRTHSGFSLSAP
jgi:hypothetical protein